MEDNRQIIMHLASLVSVDRTLKRKRENGGMRERGVETKREERQGREKRDEEQMREKQGRVKATENTKEICVVNIVRQS